jgi:hypothetical protein
MSDETVQEVPAVPPVPETPQSPATATLVVPADLPTAEDPQDASEAPEVAEEAPVDHQGNEIPDPPEFGVVVKEDGTKVYTRSHEYPIDNAEQDTWDLTHKGSAARYSLVPGDQGYSPQSDPAVVNSHLAQAVEAEILSFPARYAADPEAKVSPIWEGLRQVLQGELAQDLATGGGNSDVEV